MFFRKKITAKELTAFTQDLATLLHAQVPLTQSLETLQKQQKNPHLRLVLKNIAHAVRAGQPFSLSLTRYPKLFDSFFINMVKAGEISGSLDLILKRIATFKEKRLKLKTKIKTAMLYPTLVMGIASLLTILLFTFVVPKFETIFSDILNGAPLPALTQSIIVVSRKTPGILAFVIPIIPLTLFSWKCLPKKSKLKRVKDKLLLATPHFGTLIQHTNIALLSRTLGTLLANGVPILQALTITQLTIKNPVVSHALKKAQVHLQQGETLASTLRTQKIFPPMMIDRIHIGEETGILADTLSQIADTYEESLEATLNTLTALIEPALVILLSLFVGTIVIALFLPIVGIVENML